METPQQLIDAASSRLQTARHILDITYPAVKNPKLFLSSLEHVFLSMDYAMNAVLESERQAKKIPPFSTTFTGRYSAFRMNCASRLGFRKEDTEALLRMRNLLVEHRKSPMEFVRNDSLVICTNEYEMTILSMESMKRYILPASSFLETAGKALKQESLSSAELSH